MQKLIFSISLTLIFFLSQSIATAQPYHKFLENNSWFERVSNFGGTNYYWFYKSNDTLISSINYTTIRVSSSLEEYYVREDTVNKQVYIKYMSAPEELIYDFSLTPGSVFIYQSVSFLLDSIGSIATSFGNRNIFYYHNIANSSMQATAIEGIGSTVHPMTFKVFISDPVFDLICTYIGNAQYYYSDLDSCPPNIYIGIEKITGTNPFSIFPNPAHNKITIKWPQLNSRLEIFNILGDRIYTAIIKEPETKIELNNAVEGFYFVRISDGQNVYSQKFLIQ